MKRIHEVIIRMGIVSHIFLCWFRMFSRCSLCVKSVHQSSSECNAINSIILIERLVEVVNFGRTIFCWFWMLPIVMREQQRQYQLAYLVWRYHISPYLIATVLPLPLLRTPIDRMIYWCDQIGLVGTTIFIHRNGSKTLSSRMVQMEQFDVSLQLHRFNWRFNIVLIAFLYNSIHKIGCRKCKLIKIISISVNYTLHCTLDWPLNCIQIDSIENL